VIKGLNGTICRPNEVDELEGVQGGGLIIVPAKHAVSDPTYISEKAGAANRQDTAINKMRVLDKVYILLKLS
jgi:hypothetical protein